MTTILNCKITNTSTQIRLPYIDDITTTYLLGSGYHSGIDLYADTIYSICPCVCTYVGYDDQDKNVIIVQYDASTSFRYANLKDVSVEPGDIIESGQELGHADKFVHFEYLNRQPSKWCVRVGHESYYKHDPISYVMGEVKFNDLSQYTTYDAINVDIDLKVQYGELVQLMEDDTILNIQDVKTSRFEKLYGDLNKSELSYILAPKKFKYENRSAQDLVGCVVAISDDSHNTSSYAVILDVFNGASWNAISSKCAKDLGCTDLQISSGCTHMSRFSIYADFDSIPDWRSILNNG